MYNRVLLAGPLYPSLQGQLTISNFILNFFKEFQEEMIVNI